MESRPRYDSYRRDSHRRGDDRRYYSNDYTRRYPPRYERPRHHERIRIPIREVYVKRDVRDRYDRNHTRQPTIIRERPSFRERIPIITSNEIRVKIPIERRPIAIERSVDVVRDEKYKKKVQNFTPPRKSREISAEKKLEKKKSFNESESKRKFDVELPRGVILPQKVTYPNAMGEKVKSTVNPYSMYSMVGKPPPPPPPQKSQQIFPRRPNIPTGPNARLYTPPRRSVRGPPVYGVVAEKVENPPWEKRGYQKKKEKGNHRIGKKRFRQGGPKRMGNKRYKKSKGSKRKRQRERDDLNLDSYLAMRYGAVEVRGGE